jgi:hypothetical protein
MVGVKPDVAGFHTMGDYEPVEIDLLLHCDVFFRMHHVGSIAEM